MGEMVGEMNGPLLGHKGGGTWQGLGGQGVASGDSLPVGMTQEGRNIGAAIERTLKRLPCSVWGPFSPWLSFQRGDKSFRKAASDRRSQRFSGHALTSSRAPVGWWAGWQGSASLLRGPGMCPGW